MTTVGLLIALILVLSCGVVVSLIICYRLRSLTLRIESSTDDMESSSKMTWCALSAIASTAKRKLPVSAAELSFQKWRLKQPYDPLYGPGRTNVDTWAAEVLKEVFQTLSRLGFSRESTVSLARAALVQEYSEVMPTTSGGSSSPAPAKPPVTSALHARGTLGIGSSLNPCFGGTALRPGDIINFPPGSLQAQAIRQQMDALARQTYPPGY